MSYKYYMPPVENIHQKKLWELHQQSEYTRVNKHKEGVCFGCFSRDTVYATMVDVCKRCYQKYGFEATLAVQTWKIADFCYFCKHFQLELFHINVRLCQKCFDRITNGIRTEFIDKGGREKLEPVNVKMRKKLGKDWKILQDEVTK